MVNLKEATEYLVANGYMLCIKGKYKVTRKFYKEIEHPAGALVTQQLPVVRIAEAWPERYLQFIRDAGVPARREGSKGNVYDTNKYSDGAMKVFKKILESGIKYELLVLSTGLYYKSSVNSPVAIGRYIEEGLWRTDYDALELSAQQGTIKDHIKQTTNNGQHDFTTVG